MSTLQIKISKKKDSLKKKMECNACHTFAKYHCARCLDVAYCSSDCARNDWRNYRNCNAIADEAPPPSYKDVVPQSPPPQYHELVKEDLVSKLLSYQPKYLLQLREKSNSVKEIVDSTKFAQQYAQTDVGKKSFPTNILLTFVRMVGWSIDLKRKTLRKFAHADTVHMNMLLLMATAANDVENVRFLYALFPTIDPTDSIQLMGRKRKTGLDDQGQEILQLLLEQQQQMRIPQ